MAIGEDAIGSFDGVGQISEILRERFPPDAIDSIFQDMVTFMYLKRTDQNAGAYLMEFDMLRQRAEARMITGCGFPDELLPELRRQNAALAENENTLVLASLGNTLALQSVSAQMRRLFGPCFYASRQDVLVAADTDTAPGEADFEARMAYRQA